MSVKQQLRRLCHERDGDAVINCEFEYRIATSPGLLLANQIVEIFAYGTAVRFKDRGHVAPLNSKAVRRLLEAFPPWEM